MISNSKEVSFRIWEQTILPPPNFWATLADFEMANPSVMASVR
jgi:hypothetical protein